jgi:Mrp family chromosome partitioning ATPase/DUF971 family protein
VAANLALYLAKSGLKVGILDADIYGPSLPFLLKHESNTIVKSPRNPKFILPLISKYGLRTMSFGFVNPNAGVAGAGGKDAAVIRGPIASRVITQLLCATEWGPLDYLIVDMPPGTGDVQITLSQSAFFSGAVVVTTPHPLSTADVKKGIEMFRQVKVPIVALVENMAYFKCELGKTYYPFGRAGKDTIKNTLLSSSESVCRVVSIPMLMSSDDEDQDVSLSNSQIERVETVHMYSELSDVLLDEIFNQIVNAKMIPSVSYIENRGVVLRYFSPASAVEFVIPKEELRKRDPRTGALKLNSPSMILNGSMHTSIIDVKSTRTATPVHFDVRGNYGVAITWSDGHYSDIFPFDILKKIADEMSSRKY